MKRNRLVQGQSQGVVSCAVAVVLLAVVSLAFPALAQVTGDSRWPGLNPNIPEPSFPALCKVNVGLNGEPAGVLYANQVTGNISDVPDSRLQNAIDVCAPGPGQPAVGLELAVSGSKNAFVIGPTELAAGVTLIVNAGVTVFVSPSQTYGQGVITVDGNSTPYTGGAMGYWGIMGYGIIDGQGSAGYGARLIQLASGSWNSSDYFTLYKITLQNAGRMHVYGVGNNFLAYGVKIVTPADTANTDGIDPSGSYNVTIANSFISDGDDHIAVKAGVAPVSNVTIAHNHLYAGHGISVGSETNAGLTNMLVTDVAIDNNGGYGSSSKNSLRIKSADNVGGPVNNVLYDGVCIENGGHLFIFDPYYGQVAGGSSAPNFQAITLRDVNVVNADQTPHWGPSALRGYSANAYYPLTMTLDNVVFDPNNNLYYQFQEGSGGTSPSEYGISDASFTLGPGPVGIESLLGVMSDSDGIAVFDKVSSAGVAPYDCSSKYTYLAGELFGSSSTVGIGAPLTLTAIVQPTVASSMEGAPGYVAPAPSGVITIYDNGTQIASQLVTPPAASYLCHNGVSLCSSQRSVTDIVIPAVSAGTHVYTAAYSGDFYYLPGNSFGGITAVGGAYNDVIPVPPSFPSFTVQATGAAGSRTFVTPVLTAAAKTYDGTAYEPVSSVTCTLVPAVSGLGCAAGAAVFTSMSGGANIPVSVTGIYLTGSSAGGYALTTTTATANASILPIVPTLVVTCSPVAFDGNAHSCVGGATGIGGVPVNGSWNFIPNSETAVGTYTITGTFTSYDASYASGGQATGTLVIKPAVASLAVARVIPYMTSLFAGFAGQSTATFPYIVGQACDGGSGRIALDQYGDGCLATEAVMYSTYAVVFDSAGNAYIANYDPAGFSFVQKVDAVTGVISMFAGGMSASASGNSPCSAYSNSTHTGPDPYVTSLSYANYTSGDGCPAVDPVTGKSYSYLKGIRDVAIDAKYLYIADSSNSKIRKVSLADHPVDAYHYYAHEMEPVAGYSGSGWSQDGSVNTVKIKSPYSVAVDSTGNVYFGDQSGNSIRRVTPTTYASDGAGGVVVTTGTVTTVLNCSGSGTSCVQPSSSSVCPSGSPAGASRNVKTYTVTGMAFDAAGNMYYAANHCYSYYMIAANSQGQIDGSTAVTTVIGTGVSGQNQSGSWIPAFSTGYPLSSARGVVSAGGGNMYLITSSDVWLYDASDITSDAPYGWLYDFWGNDWPGYGCTSSVGTNTYYGCPAATSSFAGGSAGGKGGVDPHGNLYIADGGDNLVLEAATGLDFMGTGPQRTTIGSASQLAMIHGIGIEDDTVGITSPFTLADGYNSTYYSSGHCVTYYGYADGGADCVYEITYVPSGTGYETGTLFANGTPLPVDGYVTNISVPVTASVSCASKYYDATKNEPTNNCVCKLKPSIIGGVCTMGAASYSQAQVGNNLTVTVTSIALQVLSSVNYVLLNTTATTLANIYPAAPKLTITCPGVTYDGNMHSCTATATGSEGIAVSGTFGFSPEYERAVGSYPVTVTFTSYDPNYINASASGTLVINPAQVIPVAPAITSAASTTFTMEAAGRFTVTATGSPTPTLTESGALPGGVMFNSAGILSGTPQVRTAGSYPITITASNGVKPDAVQKFTLTVAGLTPTVTLAPSFSTILPGQPLSVLVTYAAPIGSYGNGMLSGTVTLTSAGYSSSAVSSYNSKAMFVIPAAALTIGANTLTATYTPDTYSKAMFVAASSSAVVTVSSGPAAALPVISLAAGTYPTAQTVTISDATAGATIYYTIDGTAPTAWSSVYTGLPITVSSTEVVQAIAVAIGYTPSAIACADYTIAPQIAGMGEWAWIGGAGSGVTVCDTYNDCGQAGVYGIMGTPDAANIPGSRRFPVSWTDGSGNFWLFGGVGLDGNGILGELNDLWKFDPSTRMWTWMGGSRALDCDSGGNCNQPGVYGALGTPAAGNTPGGREFPQGWTDTSGNFWLFGGYGMDSTGTYGDLNDLWKFDLSTRMWTWMGGSSTVVCDQNGNCGRRGVYGTPGTPAAGNLPGGRYLAGTWTDRDGSFWLFGGTGLDSTGTEDFLNDLWKFTPSTGEWTWVSGSNLAGQTGVYGALGRPAVANVPGGRDGVNGWSDSSGNFWLFAGEGYDSSGNCCMLNDLWTYSPLTSQWTWVGGSDTFAGTSGKRGVYGALGVPASTTVPGGRFAAAGWLDGSGNYWMLGGHGYGATGGSGYLNDLWKLDASTRGWTWMSGSETVGQTEIYGTLGVPSAGNTPGGREAAAHWIDGSGHLYLFGGYRFDAYHTSTMQFNDMWEYVPAGTILSAATPVFNLASGSYPSAQPVTIEDATSGATIYYTTDGTAPTTGSSVYNGPITVEITQTITAMATAGGYTNSPVATAAYNLPPVPPVLTVACPKVAYNGGTHSCTGTATGVGEVAVSGTWNFSPASETNAGSYPVSGTFTSSDPRYSSGGGAGGTLVITQADSTTTVTCSQATYNGAAQNCTASVAPAGPCSGLVAQSNAGSYTETATCTPNNANYAPSSGSAILKIDPAVPAVSVSCPTVNFDGAAHGCTATAAGVGGAAVAGSFTFVPGVKTAVGTYPEVATFTSNDPNYTAASGAGTLVIVQPQQTGTPMVALSASAVAFANPIMLTQNSPAQYVQIASTGTGPLVVSSVALGGANPGDFVVTNQAGTCASSGGASLPFNTKCNLRVVFAPAALGTRTAVLSIYDNAAGAPQQVVLTGTAISGAQLAVSATTLTFPATKVNATAPTQYLTLKSTGFVNAVISGLSLSDASAFLLSDQAGACVVNAKNNTVTSLAPGANCNIRVQFKPAVAGAISATLTITDNTNASTKVVTLNGTGQ